jgi:thiamine biosynthesis lipoprotein
VRVDLGGIAKGYAVDKAIEAMREARVAGGMVDVGGDLRCFGRPPAGQTWSVQVRDPFASGVLGKFQLKGSAVCTSGGYTRFVEIDGRRYGHIVDPRTGLPVDHVASVTVVAPTALAADVWATALSVHGQRGLEMLPEGAEALLVTGNASAPKLVGNGRFPAAIQRYAAGSRK